MSKPKHQFDPNAAFKNIVSSTEVIEEEINQELNNEPPTDIKKEEEIEKPKNIMIISKPKAERKTKAVHLLLKPSTHEKAQKKCKKIDVSLNECINQLLELWINE